MDPIQLGKFLSQLRNEKNLTQEELADKLYIDKRKVSRWECGTSIPDFDLLIKISEILDVSLYELSICQRIKDDKISTKVINKLKSIKDYKKVKLKRKIIIALKLLFIFISIFAIIYTITNQGDVEIYDIQSNSKEYNINGHLIKYNDQTILNITNIYIKNISDKIKSTDNCELEIFNGKRRIAHIKNNLRNDAISVSPYTFTIDDYYQIQYNSPFTLTINCNLQNINNFDFYLEKKYSNSIF